MKAKRAFTLDEAERRYESSRIEDCARSNTEQIDNLTPALDWLKRASPNFQLPTLRPCVSQESQKGVMGITDNPVLLVV